MGVRTVSGTAAAIAALAGMTAAPTVAPARAAAKPASAKPPCAQPSPAPPPPGFFAYHCARLRERGIVVGYREKGHGRPLVMISGFGTTAALWDPDLIAPLAAHHRVIAPDNRGTGTTTNDTPHRITITQMADDVAALIRSLHLRRRPDVLGWSMGGYIAQRLALRHPSSVRRLILAATDPGGPHAVQARPWAMRILSNPASTPQELLPTLFPPSKIPLGTAWYARIATQIPYLPPPASVVSAHTIRLQNRAEGPLWYRRGRGTYGRLPRIRQPALVADGARDVLEPPANSRMIARRIPDARLHIYPDAGHAFLVQYNTAFAGRVNRFLAADLKRRHRHGHGRRHSHPGPARAPGLAG